MSERASRIEAPVPSADRIPNIAGSKRPEAAGHRFGPDLTCIECGKAWDLHQVEPTVCAPAPDRAAEYAARLEDGL